MALSLETVRHLKHLLVSFSCHELLIEHQRQELATLDQFNLYGAFRRLVSDRHKKVLEPRAIVKFMRENNYAWVGTHEALLLISEFANENLRKEKEVDATGRNLSFGEFQRCFMPCESPELRANLS